MPAPTPFSSPHNQPQFPALYLYPLNDSFVPKHILLNNNQHVKIGRQTNVKTVPAERNGYFDSKVLSRQHAEVWEEAGKIFIKDVKSSNGTFINSERLSPEGLESDPYELKTDDIVEFGIDIVGEDNKTIIHHKVAARVVCVLSEQDLQAAARAEQLQNVSALSGMSSPAGPSNPSTSSFNFSTAQAGPSSTQRRPLMQQQGISGMGGLGGSMRPPGKSGLTFDHILSRLQGELQKSRETGAELHSLTGAMGDIHDTLGGALPANLPPYPPSLPSVRPAHSQTEQSSTSDPNQAVPLSALGELQTQLHETQSSLSTHIDKIRALEGVLAEHETMKREIHSLRELMEQRKREMEFVHDANTADLHHHERDHHDDEQSVDDLEDDARSIRTLVPHELERVVEEDEDQLAAEEEEEEDRRRRREELGRPRTPEPTCLGLTEEDYEVDAMSSSSQRSPSPPSHDPRPQEGAVIDELTRRLAALSDRLESALELSTHLQVQHAVAQNTISDLVAKVSALEALVQTTQGQIQAQQSLQEQAARDAQQKAAQISSQEQVRERESLTQMLNEWKKAVEGQWSVVKEEWSQERERLCKAREEWENKVKSVETGLGFTVAKLDSGLASLAAAQGFQHHRTLVNGDAKHGGLVTPPSPRSLSSDSNRTRHRRKRSSSSRGRSRSLPHRNVGNGEFSEDSHHESVAGTSGSPVNSRSYSPSLGFLDSLKKQAKMTAEEAARSLATPDPSVQLSSSQSTVDSKSDHSNLSDDGPPLNMSTAVGVLVLSVAAAAVLWRVKPE